MSAFFRRQNSKPAADLSLPPLSLIYPQPRPAPVSTAPHWEQDIGLDDLVSALTLERAYRPFVRAMLTNLTTETDVIRWRQAVLSDFVNNPTMTAIIEELLPQLNGLNAGSATLGGLKRSLLLETTDRISELDLYTELLDRLHQALDGAMLQSAGMQALRDVLAERVSSPDFRQLRQDLPALREPLQSIGSLTVGINLDMNLRPLSAVLISINGREVGEPLSLVDKLLGRDESDQNNEKLYGIAPSHNFPNDPKMRRYNDLFQDVEKLMEQTAKPIAQQLRAYLKTTSSTLVTLAPEMAFFVGAVRMMNTVREKGITFCVPDVLPMTDRAADVRGLVNIALALRDDSRAVPSDLQFDDSGRVAVLTGPNSGGKTTYLRNVALAQVMFQAGLMLPAQSAKISPVDRLLTHFPRLETREQGRLEEEAARLRELFRRITPNSLVLLNETFSSTALSEALYLAQDILAAMCAVGARAIFATHIVELIEQFATIEAAVTPQSHLFSLVAGITLDDDGSARPTYQITRRDPLGRSYAHEIAKRHGISLEQILNPDNNNTP